MRMRMNLVAALALVTAAAGCGDDTTTGNDMAVAPDLTMQRDLAMPDLVPQITYSGTVVVTEVSGTVPVPMGDAGVQQVPAKLMSPSVGFTQSPGKAHDYNDIPAGGLPIGCTGDHYGAGDTPEDDIDAGTITIGGYKQPTSLTGMMLPTEINCAWDMTTKRYACGYGPLVNGKPSPIDPGQAPYGQMHDSMPKDAMVSLKGTGAGPFGTFNKADVVAAGPIATTEDLTKLTFDPAQDIVLNIKCPDTTDGKCTSSAVVVSISAQATPTSPPTGAIRCAGFATNPTITVKKGAIAAMLGCDNTGKNCDPALKIFRTIVLHLPLPASDKDSKGNGLTLLAGHGTFGISVKQ